ncbi:TPA: hypothetical protein PBB95_002608 [Staphylococcus aureus]|uniref:hypothetical protein n=1 Tax=Staphylococcus TaxID=1279 RepID=UPI00065C12D8|nr:MULTISPECIES: hypothetical protein [Staphylococcus]KMR50885.1 hypothetical protein EX85_09360 [Staphylococcus aureus]MDU9350485.1 hypothetical protein [Staphylococcus ureilyticus]HDD5896079.1 hypothetical protein [Staphylococcus aureus]HDZ8780184.1 hypothetical protein [Staphylococcus aureus]
MNTVFLKKEMEIAYEYFHEAVIEIDSNEMFESNIKDLVRYLHSNDFSIEDVLGFYSLSDLQDELDILRLMEYINVTNDPRKHCAVNSDMSKPLASNRNGYLIIIDEEEIY